MSVPLDPRLPPAPGSGYDRELNLQLTKILRDIAATVLGLQAGTAVPGGAQPLSDNLTALAGLTGTGMVVRTGDTTYETQAVPSPGTPIVASGTVTLVAGTRAISVPGISAANRAFTQLAVAAGTIGVDHKAACTTDTLTVTAVQSNGTTQTLDTSTFNYAII